MEGELSQHILIFVTILIKDCWTSTQDVSLNLAPFQSPTAFHATIATLWIECYVIKGISDAFSTHSLFTMSLNSILPLFIHGPIIISHKKITYCRWEKPTFECKGTNNLYAIQAFRPLFPLIYNFLTNQCCFYNHSAPM